jgi:hypothetical protein
LVTVGCHVESSRGGVEALALHNVGREAWRRYHGSIFREETGISDEDAADLRVLSRADRMVASNLAPHLLQADRTVPRTQQLPGIRYPHRHEAAEEATPNNLVVRVVRLEEEGLTSRARGHA